MKKAVLPMTIFFLFISIICVLFINQPKKYIKDSKKYKDITIDEITEIEVSYQSLVEIEPIHITDKDEIKNIYDTLGNIQVLDKKGAKVMDAGMIITIIKGEPISEYVFEGEYYKIDDDNYEIIGLDKLNKLLSQYLK